jgi:GT2 family glycosyltransferase
VFNRAETTLRVISALAGTRAPHTLTVVDNGSRDGLRAELLALHKHKKIRHLYFLDDNYGVSCACNVGWRLHEAPIYMKLDNDMLVLSDDWLGDILGMWGKNRYRTLFGPVWNCSCSEGRNETPHGVFWTLPVSFSGAAFLVSKKVIETIGYFNEDYGVYGEEDADYCLRCHHAGIRKYAFECRDLIFHDSSGDGEYQENNVDKRSLHKRNVGAEGKGIFALNLFLYENGLRPLNVALKYGIVKVAGHEVTVEAVKSMRISSKTG